MKTFHILIFGCQMNYADSARIKAVLHNCGFLYVEDIKKADVVIFDTCSVRQKAEDKITGKLKEISPKQKVWITGCMIQHNLKNKKASKGNFLGSLNTPKVDDLPMNESFNPLFCNLRKKWKNVELFWRIDDTGFLPLMLQKLGYKVKYDKELINEYEYIIPQGNTSMNAHGTTAYVPISTGCNQFCAYCIVPYARGREKYFAVEKIVDDVKVALRNGAKEIVLVGQIVNKHPQFVKIVKDVLALKGLRRLRYTSPYPTYYSPELIALHGQEVRLCPHIHMPIQSGSDAVLKRMFRGYDVKSVRKRIREIRALKRDVSITTDIIVGFPGETDDDFKKTLQLVKYGKFDMIFIGIYSPRPGTLGAKKYEDDIPRKVKRERWNALNNLLIELSVANNKKEIGNIHDVLINEIQDGQLVGVTDNGKQIIVKNVKGVKGVGEFVKVKIVEGVPFKLYGEIVS